MSDAIQVIKEYIKTPEGAEWFMNAVKDAQDQIRLSEKTSRLNHTSHEEDVVKQLEKALPLYPPKNEHNMHSLLVSKRELENVIQWTEKHPNPDTDGRYILKVTLAGGRQVLKSSLLTKRESVSNSHLITDDPKKILSGEITRVTTKGTHSETYNISQTD